MDNQDYWFPAKTCGWGWGLPRVWQGWAVLVGYVAGMAWTSYRAPPDENPVVFFGATALLTVALLVVCWLKGEPPRWRWG